jgi:hypothetical protein
MKKVLAFIENAGTMGTTPAATEYRQSWRIERRIEQYRQLELVAIALCEPE